MQWRVNTVNSYNNNKTTNASKNDRDTCQQLQIISELPPGSPQTNQHTNTRTAPSPGLESPAPALMGNPKSKRFRMMIILAHPGLDVPSMPSEVVILAELEERSIINYGLPNDLPEV